jgi:hypothetical protein
MALALDFDSPVRRLYVKVRRASVIFHPVKEGTRYVTKALLLDMSWRLGDKLITLSIVLACDFRVTFGPNAD